MPPLLRPLALAAALSACTTLSALNTASTALDAYTLNPPTVVAPGSPVDRQVVVEVPTSSGAIGSDRIMIKPSPREVQYLPGARWIDPVPVMVQSLVIHAIADTGRVRYVSGGNSAVLPDATLMIDIQDFQAELGPPEGPPARVVVRMDMALVREPDGQILATRRFERTVAAGGIDTRTVVAAFDAATQAVLAEAAVWATAAAVAEAGA